MSTPLDVTRPELIRSMTIEVTNLCNLKCRYCWSRASKLTESRVLSTEIIANVVGFCKRYGITTVDLTGGGELTMAPNWQSVCLDFLDNGISLNVTTNLAKPLSREDFDILSRFSGICISLDSVDKQALANTRVGSDITLILYNLIRLRAAAVKLNRNQPKIGFTAVLSAETAPFFCDLASTVVALDAERFHVIDLVVDKRLENNVSPVWVLKDQAAESAKNAITHGLALVRSSPTKLIIQPEIEERLSYLGMDHSDLHLVSVNDSHRQTYMKTPSTGQTRNCLDPWQLLQIYGDGKVVTCCFGSFIIGNLNDGKTLEDILDDKSARTLRNQLVTGTLNPKCNLCTFRPLVPVDEYQQKIQRLVDGNNRFEAEAITISDNIK